MANRADCLPRGRRLHPVLKQEHVDRGSSPEVCSFLRCNLARSVPWDLKWWGLFRPTTVGWCRMAPYRNCRYYITLPTQFFENWLGSTQGYTREKHLHIMYIM